MTFNRSIRTSDAKKERARELRTQGYDDGYAGRPAALSLMVYQQSYRRGQDARKNDEPSESPWKALSRERWDADHGVGDFDRRLEEARKGDAA